jgi:branched-chain amino acid transport system permease protein
VGVNYGGVVALQDIGIEVAPGSIHAIIGPNGAGKTTLLNCVSGLQRSSGGIFLDDVEIGRLSPGEIRRLGVSRTFQNPALVPDLSVVENVQLGLYGDQPSASWRDVLPVPAIGRRDAASLAAAHAVLDLMKFPGDRRLVLASDLSLAEQKLTDIARAIAGHTRVLLLDEPTAGLSDDEIGIVAEALKVINRTSGITMLVIAHHVGFLRRIADQATVLNFGRVIARGTPEEVARDKLVLDVFLGESDGQ